MNYKALKCSWNGRFDFPLLLRSSCSHTIGQIGRIWRSVTVKIMKVIKILNFPNEIIIKVSRKWSKLAHKDRNAQNNFQALEELI